MTPESLTVALPALDEAEGISQAIDDALDALEHLRAEGTVDEFEVLVIDDGSRDTTAKIVQSRLAQDRRISLEQHAENRGVGAGLRTAIGAARGEVLLYTDADMPVHLAELARALPLLRRPGVGLVAGQRKVYSAEPALRGLASRVYDQLAHLTLGVATRDVNFPFKLLTVETARRLDLRSEGALVDAELLARMRLLGLGTETLVMEYRARQFGTSKTMSFRLLRQLATELIRHRSEILSAPPR